MVGSPCGSSFAHYVPSSHTGWPQHRQALGAAGNSKKRRDSPSGLEKLRCPRLAPAGRRHATCPLAPRLRSEVTPAWSRNPEEFLQTRQEAFEREAAAAVSSTPTGMWLFCVCLPGSTEPALPPALSHRERWHPCLGRDSPRAVPPPPLDSDSSARRTGFGVPMGSCQGQQMTRDKWAGPDQRVREGTPLQGVT